MNKQIIVAITVALLCATTFTLPVLVYANFEPGPLPAFKIQSDGTISPSTPLIQQNGSTYSLVGSLTDHVLEVECSNIVLDGSGFSIFGNGAENGVTLICVSNVTVKNFSLVDCNSGIFLNSSSQNLILLNNMTKRNYYCNYGIQLSKSSDNQIENNTMIYTYYDIYLKESGGNILRNNRIISEQDTAQVPPGVDLPPPSNSGIDFVVTGTDFSQYLNDIDTSNTVNGRAVCYWIGRSNQTVPSNSAYVALIDCQNITVQNQNIYCTQGILVGWTTNSTIAYNAIHGCLNGIQVIASTNLTIANNDVWGNIGQPDSEGDGIRLVDCQGIAVLDNKFSANWNGGIKLSNSSANLIKANNVVGNWHNGINLLSQSNNNVVCQNLIHDHTTMSYGAIYLQDSQNNSIVANDVVDNSCWGIMLLGSQQNNDIYWNNFVNNSQTISDYSRLQVSMTGAANPDTWDNNNLGNYWSDYTTRYPNATATTTGTGDKPFFINANNIDHYPSTQPIDTEKIAPLPMPPAPKATTLPFPTATPSTKPSPTDTPTISPSPSPTAPEFPSWTLAILALASILPTILILKQKKS